MTNLLRGRAIRKPRAEINQELAAKARLACAWRGSDETVSLDRETDLKRIPAIN
jgi:hypothetical protein